MPAHSRYLPVREDTMRSGPPLDSIGMKRPVRRAGIPITPLASRHEQRGVRALRSSQLALGVRDAAKKRVVSQRRIWLVVLATVLVATLFLARKFNSTAGTETSPPVSPLAAPPPVAAFAPTVENKIRPADQAPAGMAWISGGEFSMGAQDAPDRNEVGMQATRDSRPIHRVYVDAFWMDKTDVTNEQFAKFVRATRYVTIAERKPRAEDFPGAPPENLMAGAVVFSP